jgi:hypothetical protein
MLAGTPIDSAINDVANGCDPPPIRETMARNFKYKEGGACYCSIIAFG